MEITFSEPKNDNMNEKSGELDVLTKFKQSNKKQFVPNIIYKFKITMLNTPNNHLLRNITGESLAQKVLNKGQKNSFFKNANIYSSKIIKLF